MNRRGLSLLESRHLKYGGRQWRILIKLKLLALEKKKPWKIVCCRLLKSLFILTWKDIVKILGWWFMFAKIWAMESCGVKEGYNFLGFALMNLKFFGSCTLSVKNTYNLWFKSDLWGSITYATSVKVDFAWNSLFRFFE